MSPLSEQRRPDSDLKMRMVNGSTMTELEFETIESHLERGHVMLEWGAGISTARLPGLVGEFHTIEHDRAWFCRLDWMHPRVHQADLVEPYLELPRHLAPRYDRVLIDGRQRVACAFSLLDHDLLAPDALVFLHDWHRKRYHGVLERFRLVDEVEPIRKSNGKIDKGLALLRPT